MKNLSALIGLKCVQMAGMMRIDMRPSGKTSGRTFPAIMLLEN
jgi:hypothetical protein